MTLVHSSTGTPAAGVCLAILAALILLLTPKGDASAADGRTERGAHPIESFHPRDYRGHAQNWVVTQGNNGLIYVGNGTGLLEYDGVEWRTIPVRGNAPVRSLAVSPDGRLFIGTSGDFGVLDADSLGRPTYRSLLLQHRDQHESISDVWAIVPADDGIYFSTRERLFRLRGDSLEQWTPEDYFALGFEYGGHFHTVTAAEGLVKMVDDVLVPTAVAREFAGDIIFYAVPHPDGSVILGSRDRGLLRYDGRRVRPFSSFNDRLVREHHYQGTALEGGGLAIATRTSGLYVLTPDGSLDRHYSEGDGLPDVHVWNVFQDRQQGLWLALNSGIARIDLENPITRFSEKNGLPGIVIDVARHEGVLHAATSKGLYRMETTEERIASFRPVIDESAGQCLGLLSTENGLLAGCELGLFLIDRSGVRKLIEHSTRLFYRLPSNPDVILASTRTSVQVLERTRSSWKVRGGLPQLPPWVISMHETKNGDLWLTTVADGIVRARPNMTFDAIPTQAYRTEAGIPEGWTYVTDIDGSPRFFTMGGVLEFDEQSGRFKPDAIVSPHLPTPDADVFLLRQAPDGTIWFLNGDDLGRISGPAGRRTTDVIRRLPDVRPTMLLPDERSGATWIASLDGLLRIESEAVARQALPLRVAVRAVMSSHGDSLIAAAGPAGLTRLELAPGTDGLRFSFALLSFADAERHRYQVRLVGVDRDWSSWSSETTKDYTNLRAGNYTFLVRGRDAEGVISEAAALEVRILPAWHETIWARIAALLLGALVLVACVSLVIRLRMARLETQKQALERQVAERTRKLERANRRLTALNEQNNDFLSIAAHDLKNPLVSVIGFSDLMLSGSVTEDERREFLSLIRESALRMNEAIEQLQTADVLETGRFELHRTPTDLVALAKSVINRNSVQADRKAIELALVAASPIVLDVDALYLGRVFDNLLSNAIKFSEPGTRVTLHVEAAGADVVITVTDQGPGLTPDDMARVFGKRERLSARPTGGEGSTGLGLYIVRKVVESHGGLVSVASETGRGATFTVRLPAGADGHSGDGASFGMPEAGTAAH